MNVLDLWYVSFLASCKLRISQRPTVSVYFIPSIKKNMIEKKLTIFYPECNEDLEILKMWVQRQKGPYFSKRDWWRPDFKVFGPKPAAN